MMILSVLGALGGIVVFTGAIFTVIRGAIRQSEAVERLVEVVDRLDTKVDDHESRLSRMEGHRV